MRAAVSSLVDGMRKTIRPRTRKVGTCSTPPATGIGIRKSASALPLLQTPFQQRAPAISAGKGHAISIQGIRRGMGGLRPKPPSCHRRTPR